MNLMGWSDQGTDDGGQYYYDLALDIDPNNGDKIHVGGVNHWISTDGGYTFTCPAKWSHSAKENFYNKIKFYTFNFPLKFFAYLFGEKFNISKFNKNQIIV